MAWERHTSKGVSIGTTLAYWMLLLLLVFWLLAVVADLLVSSYTLPHVSKDAVR